MTNAVISSNSAGGTIIRPRRVRYIKLGRKGGWEQECLRRRIIRFGFDSAKPDRFSLCQAGAWEEVGKVLRRAGKTLGAATNIANQLRAFFEDDGTTLWVTFIGERLYWGFLTQSPAEQHEDENGVWRTVKHGWSCKDINGEELTKDRLSGALTKLASYRGTSCDVDVDEYVVRRINGHKLPVVENALLALDAMKTSVLALMKLLGPRDFETLIDLVFAASGWRRLGIVGKTQKTLDLDLLLPSTGERAFVQVKSRTTDHELAEYVERLDDLGPYDRMFFVYHSGEAQTDDERVTVIGPEKAAELVLDAGLIDWLIRKVS
jgi:hypothetical protein